jgi:hypothetical protein
MEWKTLSSSYLGFDKSLVVDRWVDMSDYFIPVNDMEVEYDDGTHTVTVYKIKKGSVFYHGSSALIQHFDRIAFFSPHKEVSKTILSLLAKRLIKVMPNDSVEKKNAYLYTFRTKRDIHVVYNRNMGLGAGYTGQFSPFLVDQPIPTFCKEYAWLDGFVNFRDTAPLFPIFRLNEEKTVAQLESAIGQLQDKHRSNEYFVNEYLSLGSGRRKDPVYTAEYVFCNPQQILELVDTEILDMPTLFKRWKTKSIHWLQHLLSINPKNKKQWILDTKYDFIIGPKVSEAWRIYHDRFLVWNDRIVRGTDTDIPLTDKKLTTNIESLSDDTVYHFWKSRNVTVEIANVIFPRLLHTQEKAVLALFLTMCHEAHGKKKETENIKTLYLQLF